MFPPNIRDQLLANLKFLYGNDVEILTIHAETENRCGHQAIAATFDPFKATWTKFLHGEPDSHTQYALRGLLLESEKALAKFLTMNGNTVLFDGDMAQVLKHDRGQREVPGSPSSQQSDFVFIATPGSSLPDVQTDEEGPATFDFPDGNVHGKEIICEEPVFGEAVGVEAPNEEPVCEEPVCEEHVCEEPVYEPTTIEESEANSICSCGKASQSSDEEEMWIPQSPSKKDKKKRTKTVLYFVESTPEEPPAAEVYFKVPVPEVLPDETPVEMEMVPQPDHVCCAQCTLEELEFQATQREPEAVEPTPQEEEWASFGSARKSKKKGKKICEEIPEPPAELELEEQPVPEDEEWAPIRKSKKKGKKICEEIPEPTIEPELEEQSVPAWDDSDPWAPNRYKTKKKGRGFKAVEVILEPELEAEAQPIPAVDDDWHPLSRATSMGSKESYINYEESLPVLVHEIAPEPEVMLGWGAVKKSKKKGKVAFEDEEPIPASEPQPVPIPEEDDVWGSLIAKKEKKGKKKVKKATKFGVIEEAVDEPVPQPEPIPEVDDGWGSFATKKSKKGKQAVQEVELVEEVTPEPEPVPEEDDDWGSFVVRKSKKGKKAVQDIEVIEEPAPEPEPEPEPEPINEEGFGWGFGSKKAKKGKNAVQDIEVVEESLPEPETVEVIDERVPEPGPEPIPVADFEWGFSSKKSKKGKKALQKYETSEERVPEPEPVAAEPVTAEEDPWAEWRPKSKGQVNDKQKESDSPVENKGFPSETCGPKSEAVVEQDSWSTWGVSTKKDKKDKMKSTNSVGAAEVIDEDDWMNWGLKPKKDKKTNFNFTFDLPETKIDEVAAIPVPVPELEPEPVVTTAEDFWGFAAVQKDKKKSKKKRFDFVEPCNVEETPIPGPETAVEDTLTPAPDAEIAHDFKFGWGVPVLEKDKERNALYDVSRKAEDTPIPEPVPPQDGWGSWGFSTKKNKKLTEVIPSEETAEALQEKSVTGLRVNQLLEAAIAPGIPTAPVPRTGQMVVFTIRHPHNINKSRALEAMLFIKGNTCAAIFEAVNTYLDSREGVLPHKRALQIKSGIGRNGEVDLSAVEESMWPQYMEYFCQYTKLPELTVDVLDS